MIGGAKGVMGSALRSFPSSSSRAFRLYSGLALLPCSVLPTKPVEEAMSSLLGITNIVVVKCYPGLDVAIRGVAKATRFYSVATKFSRLVANLAPKIDDFLLWENVH